MKQPRFYQTEAKEAVIHRIRENSKKGVSSRILVDAAAGAGKTIMMAIIARHVHERGGRVLQIARQPILAEQTYREFYDFGVPSGMYAAKFNKRQVYQVTVGTEGTIVNGLADFNKPVDLLLIDESHQVDIENEDTQFMRIINHLDGVAKKAGRLMHIVGVTGSPFRGTAHLTTFDFWQDVVYDIGVDRLTEMGFLSVPIYGFPDADDDALDFSSVNTRSGSWEFSEKELDEIAMSDAGKKKLVRILMQIIEKTKDRNQRIVFASTKRHAREIRRILIALGIDKSKIGLVTDDSSESEKDRVIKLSKEGKLDWLINVSVLTTGFNSPLIDVVVYLRPIGSLVLLIQSMGRGARLLEDWMKEAGFHKENYLVLDYAGVFDRLGHLLDDPLTGAALAEKGRKSGKTKLCQRKGCGCENGIGARRCIAKDPSEPDGRCSFFWVSQTCPDCKTENDIAASECRNPKCKRELRDPNKELLHSPYSDDQLVEVKSWEITPAENGNGIMVKFNLKDEPEHGNPVVFYPTDSEGARRITMKQFIEVYCRNPRWHPEFKAQLNPRGIMKLKQALTMPSHISYRINGQNKFVIGRRRFS